MKFGIDKAAEDIAARMKAEMMAINDGIAWKVESPIERLLYITFSQYSRLFIQEHGILGTALLPNDGKAVEPETLYIGMQIVALDWPIDFVFSIQDRAGTPRQLAVECDGHDFHERTKEQAARDRSRDRALQSAGFTVMRFTGSEIYREPLKCVLEIISWAEKWNRS